MKSYTVPLTCCDIISIVTH